MKKRPIALLVDALRQLGAHITYLENEGFPPLHIEGRRLKGGEINIDGNVSSQFITGLMLIAPTLPQALKIKINGDPLSRPYILMTQNLMTRCGAQVDIDENVITVHPGRYRSKEFTIERDWSSAAFWMSFAALSRKSDIILRGLTSDSIQGDKSAIELYERLGLKCTFTERGLRVEKNGEAQKVESWNFRNHPDLVPPAAFAAAGMKQDFTMSGLDNLRLKETDRIAALENELHKIGVKTSTDGPIMNMSPSEPHTPETYFESYDDHRMVMAVAPMSMLFSEFKIENPMAVAKSYPGFWNQVEKFVDVRPTR
jgi:3-phosphoshikimate 1-carboxyvinyltransferase